MDDIAIRLRAGGGVLQRRSHSDVSGSLDRLLRTGLLTALLPGVYCATTDTGDLDVRIRAAALWGGPDAVVTSSCAARLTYWPSCRPEIVTLALPTQSKRSVRGFDLQTRRIPGWLTCRRSGVVATSPALTAVDLAGGAGGGEAIDRLLLSRAATWKTCGKRSGRSPGGFRTRRGQLFCGTLGPSRGRRRNAYSISCSAPPGSAAGEPTGGCPAGVPAIPWTYYSDSSGSCWRSTAGTVTADVRRSRPIAGDATSSCWPVIGF